MDAHILHKQYLSSLAGQIFSTRSYGQIRVLSYVAYNDVLIEFIETGYTKRVAMSQIKNGRIKDDTITSKKMELSFGVGTIGYGNYLPSQNKQAYRYWRDMLRRCYDSNYHMKYPTYNVCRVCNSWLNFQNFVEWFNQQYKEDNWQLDKDIIRKNNIIYGPEYCAFVPCRINNLFRAKRQYKKLPTGVMKKCNKYISIIRDENGRYQHLGIYNTVESAFISYKCAKERKIRKIACEFKDVIDSKIYNAMISYQIEVTD